MAIQNLKHQAAEPQAAGPQIGKPEAAAAAAAAPLSPSSSAAAAAAVAVAAAAVAAAGVIPHGTSAIQPPPPPLKHPIWWFAPIWDGSGYSTEAHNYVLSALRSGLVREEDLWVASHGGDWSPQVIDAMLPDDRDQLRRAEAMPAALLNRGRSPVVICHSMPWFYSAPKPAWKAPGARCPPDPQEFNHSYTVARTMYECDGLPGHFARRCNEMDEVWVTSQQQLEMFAANGVRKEKLRVLPEGVNTTFFDPSKHSPLEDLEARSELVFGLPWGAKKAGREASGRPFRFFSCFGWGPRKGWDVLLDAYLSEFGPGEAVELILLARVNPKGPQIAPKMVSWAANRFNLSEPSALLPVPRSGGGSSAEERGGQQQRRLLARPGGGGGYDGKSGGAGGTKGGGSAGGTGGGGGGVDPGPGAAGSLSSVAARRKALAAEGAPRGGPGGPPGGSMDPRAFPTLYIITGHVADEDLPRLYSSCDAFVLPSRGEGWGRPHAEAMSMGLPVIATNWSGTTAFLDENVGYPIAVQALVPVTPDSGFPEGMHWAQPSVQHLRSLMRRVAGRPAEAAARGRAARERMVKRYSPAAIAAALAAEFRRLDEAADAMDEKRRAGEERDAAAAAAAAPAAGAAAAGDGAGGG